MRDGRGTGNGWREPLRGLAMVARLRSLAQRLSPSTPASVRAPHSAAAFFFGSGWRVLGTVAVIIALIASGLLERAMTATGQAVMRLVERLFVQVIFPLILLVVMVGVVVALIIGLFRMLASPK